MKPHAVKPQPMLLRCPTCGAPHVDDGEWQSRPHRTHKCALCRNEWRPVDELTIGVGLIHEEPIECYTWYDGCHCHELPHVVSALMLDTAGNMFLQRRSASQSFAHKWEHPGGKVERGESHAQALVRELREELDIDVDVARVRQLVAVYADRGHYTVHLYHVDFIPPSIVHWARPDRRWISIAYAQQPLMLAEAMPSMQVFAPAIAKYVKQHS